MPRTADDILNDANGDRGSHWQHQDTNMTVPALNDAALRAETAAENAAASAVAAGAARDAAIAAGSWTYNVDTAADLAGLTPSPDDTALVLDTMHVWRWDGSDWIDTGESALAVKADQTQVDEIGGGLVTTQQGLAASFDVGKVSLASRAGGTYFDVAGGAYDWGIGLVGGVDVAAGAAFDACRFALQIHGDATQVRYRLWSRPLDAAWMAQGPGYAGDIQHGPTVLSSPGSLGLTPGGPRGLVTFGLGTVVQIEAGRLYIHEIEALDAGGTRVMSAIEYKLINGLTTDQYRKWRRAGGPNNAWSNQVTSTTFVYCYDLLTDGFGVKPPADHYSPAVADALAAVDGLDVSVSGRTSQQGGLLPFSGAVTLDAATGGTVTDEALTLTAASGSAFTYGYLTNRTAHADLRSVVVKDASTLAVLVKGTDYWAIEELGAFSLPGTSGTPRDVLISYTWSMMRYDLIHYSPATGVIAVTKGTERERDQSEFVPAAPVGAIPLYHVHVRSGGNIAVPVWDVAEGVRRSRRAETDEETARNRRLLRPVLRKLRSGVAVKIVSYGDSNFAQMGGPYNLAAVRSTANTIYHDRTKDTGGLLRTPAYGADVLATIPTYDTGDGAGQVHTRFGLVWELIRALEAGFASAITYRNCSIPGTNSTNVTYQGQDATRLAAATGEAADFAIIGFGQNELGQSYTRDNVAAICEAFKAAGTIPLVMGCFRPHAADFHSQHTTANWLITQRHLREAAQIADVPHVSMLTLYAEGETGPLGLSQYDFCAATKDVHPGIREHRVIGARLAAIFDGV